MAPQNVVSHHYFVLSVEAFRTVGHYRLLRLKSFSWCFLISFEEWALSRRLNVRSVLSSE